MQPLNAKNISEVRDEYDGVSKAIGRFGLIRATIIGISAFVLASGLNKISSSDVSTIVSDLKKNFQITQETPDFNDLFLSAIYFRSFQQSSGAEAAANASEQAAPVFSDQQKQEAKERQNELVAKLKAEAQKAFDLSFNAPLLGAKIDIDLKFWGFVLPIFAIFSESYLTILRYKRRLIFKIGALLVRRDPDNASSWDLIQFSERNNRLPPVMRFPAQYEAAVSWICALALVGYVAYSGNQFWSSWDPGSLIVWLAIYLFIGIYAVAYVAYAKRQLRSQILPLRGLRAPQLFAAGLPYTFSRSITNIARRVPAKLNVVSGSLAALCTLWLLVATGCEGSQTGFQYLKHPTSGWLSGPLGVSDLLFGNSLRPQVIWIFYLAGLLLASFSLLIVWRLQAIDRHRNLASGCRDLAAIICMFFVTDLCFGDLLAASLPTDKRWTWLTLTMMVVVVSIWVVPIAAWIRYRHPRFRLKRRSVLRWYQPQIVFAIFYCLPELFTSAQPRIGVPVFVTGVALIAAGYASLSRSRSATLATRTSPTDSQFRGRVRTRTTSEPEPALTTTSPQRGPISVKSKHCVPQPFGLSTALVRNWSSLFLNRIL